MADICNASIQEIHQFYKDKQMTVKDVVLAYLLRISEIDKCRGGLNSVLEINPDALFIAGSFDERLRSREEFTALFGIPVLLKDNINTQDRLHTSAGSVALAGNYAPYDAHIVKRLRQAGAIILGKTNMTEFANYMTENMPSGYSSRGGQVVNPYNKDITPSGSSSGSAVAVAAGFCTVSVGTETSGSIISPAGYNGIVGIKPTLGLVGRSGVIPISGTLDTAGPMARTVRDATILLGAISGVDPGDAATWLRSPPTPPDYTMYLEADGLKGMRIGIDRSHNHHDFFTLSDEGKAAFDNLCQVLSAAGALLVDLANRDFNANISRIMHYEFKSCMNYYLSTLNGSTRIRTLCDITEYNQTNAAIALKYGQSILLDAENNTSGTMTEPEYLEALMERERIIYDVDKIFDDNNLDIMLCETFSNIAPIAGFPSMTIPTGQRKDKIPTDSFWMARRFDEATLIKAAYSAEQHLGLNLTPELIK